MKILLVIAIVCSTVIVFDEELIRPRPRGGPTKGTIVRRK